MNEAQSPQASGITGMMLIGVVMIPWITLVISEVYLWLYRRAVVRAMAAQRTDLAEPIATSPPASTVPGQVTLAIREAGTDTAPASAGGVLFERLRRARTATAAVYVVAGLVYAGLMAAVLVVQSGLQSVGAWLAFTVGFAWPAVLTALLIDPPRRRRWRAAIVIGYVAVFLFGTAVPPAREFLLGIFTANLGATMVSLVVRARRIHAVAPLVGAVLTIVGAALLLGVGFTMLVGNDPARPEGAPMEAGRAFLLLGVLFALIAAGPVTAWFTLRLVAARYGRKRTSDQNVGMSALWLTFAGVHSATYAFLDARWMLAGVFVFLAFAIVVTRGFRLARRRAPNARAPRLLVLRVFALGRKSRRLFDRFATLWRHIGSVQLIAGPDLASSTVEPHEFLDFIRRRIGDRFLDSDQSIKRALADLDTDPDPDGRYRVTDFICRDHAWRTVFGRLAANSDVVLMDLRGFSAMNAGCTYELGELLDVVPVERITVIINQSTDEDFLIRTLEQARAGLHADSPNNSDPVLRLQVFRETGRRSLDPDRLLRLLCEAATLSGQHDPVAQAG
jgi:hypothetical protein